MEVVFDTDATHLQYPYPRFTSVFASRAASEYSYIQKGEKAEVLNVSARRHVTGREGCCDDSEGECQQDRGTRELGSRLSRGD
jgi:hypothetical protein